MGLIRHLSGFGSNGEKWSGGLRIVIRVDLLTFLTLAYLLSEDNQNSG